MARPIAYCDGCGRIIMPSEFDQGRALELANGVLCHECFEALPADRRATLSTRQTPRPSSDGKSPFAAVQHQSTTRRTNPMIKAVRPPKTALVFLGAGIGGGLLVGALLILLLSKPQGPSSIELPNIGPAPAAVAPPPVVVSQPAEAPQPIVNEVSDSNSTTAAAARLTEIREKITPGLEKYDEVVRKLKYFDSDFEAEPEVAAAKELLATVERDYATLAEDALAKAQSNAAQLVSEGRREVAVSALRGVKARFRGSEWFTSGGARRIDEAISGLKAAPAASTAEPTTAPAAASTSIPEQVYRSETVPPGTTASATFDTEDDAGVDVPAQPTPEEVKTAPAASVPVRIHGAWAELENGIGRVSSKDDGRASGGKIVTEFYMPGKAVYVTVNVVRMMEDARVFLRYTRGQQTDGALDVFLGPPGKGWQKDPGMRKLGEIQLKSTTGWGIPGWTSISAGNVEPGVWRILFVLNEKNGAGDLDVAGLVPGNAPDEWTPPNRTTNGKLFDEGYLNALAETAEDRTRIIEGCVADARSDGYRLDLITLWTLATAGDAKRALKSKSFASLGGPAVASRAFDSELHKKLTPRGGYRVERALAISNLDVTGDAVAKAFARYLSRARPELVRICFDESNLSNDTDFDLVKSTLYACTSLALQSGAAPVLFTAPAYTGPGAKSPGAVTKYNDIVAEVARVMHVPFIDATRILNGDEENYKTLFDRNRRLKPAAFDAINESFLELYAKLERWVFKR